MNKSRLVLGTAQLGMKYGIANTSGAPAKDEAFAILDAALEGGINTFDTAAAYGESEGVLGAWIGSRAAKKDIYIITKIAGDDPATMRREIEASLSRLRIGRLDGCLLHVPQNMYKADVLGALQEAKKAGLVSNVGVSIYDEADALHAIELGIDYVQVPYNVFDQRLDRTEFFTHVKKKSVTVFARSPFLQGLLLMDPAHVPPHLSHARPYLERFVEIASRHDLSQLEAAFGFAYRHSRADHIVFGVETVFQLQEIIGGVGVTSQEPSWVGEMAAAFQEVDRTIIDPSVWKKV